MYKHKYEKYKYKYLHLKELYGGMDYDPNNESHKTKEYLTQLIKDKCNIDIDIDLPYLFEQLSKQNSIIDYYLLCKILKYYNISDMNELIIYK